MKFKHWLVALSILFILLGYNMLCYFFINRVIESDSKIVINNYLSSLDKTCNFKYKYLKTLPNNNGSLNIYVKVSSDCNQDEYLTFVVLNNGRKYNLLEVNKNVPRHIK